MSGVYGDAVGGEKRRAATSLPYSMDSNVGKARRRIKDEEPMS